MTTETFLYSILASLIANIITTVLQIVYKRRNDRRGNDDH